MAQVKIKVDPGRSATARLSFKGIAKYSAYLFAPAAGDQWMVVATLCEDASSIDARPDVLVFDGPSAGKSLLFFLKANVTAATVPADVAAEARIEQDGATCGTAAESTHIDGGYASIVVRALLVTS